MKQPDSLISPTRRGLLQASLGAAALIASPLAALAAAPPGFDAWRDGFRARALAKGISEATWNRVMGRIEPDMSVFKNFQKQPEFTEQIWQYINRRVSDWRITNGREALKKNEALFARIEQEYGVERGTLLALWGVESAYGDPLVQQNHMRPIFPSLAALAWNEPRRKAYWETELINALKIVDKGWSTPDEMRGSWAGAMGHTQWMPEVWLNVGIDYDRDGRVSPFGKPDDALGSSARYLVNRGRYHRGEHWGYEVRGAGGASAAARPMRPGPAPASPAPTENRFRKQMRRRSCGRRSRAGPSFLLGPNFNSVKSYNPSMNYALAICHLGDRILGGPTFIQPFPGSERALTLAEIQEMQTRLTKAGFDTGGTDGRVGNDTMKAVKDYQAKTGLLPADGYGGLKVLARLRQGS